MPSIETNIQVFDGDALFSWAQGGHLQISIDSSFVEIGGRDTPMLDQTRDVQADWVSFRDQKSADSCTCLPKNLPMGYNLNP